MDTDNPAGPASIEDRLGALVSPEAADAPEEPVEQTPGEADDTEIEAEAQEPDVIDFEDDEGKSHKIPAALKDYVTRRADYTRKTMAAANLAEVAQDRIQFADARETFSEVLSQKAAEIGTLKAQHKQLVEMDVSGLDPATLWQLGRRADALKEQIQQSEQQYLQGKSQIEGIARQHAEKQWGLAVKGAIDRIGSYTPGEDAAMLKLVNSMGFTDKELKGRFADPRFLHMAFKAAKWDTLQAGKGKSLEAAKGAPPVVKPGASKGPGAAAEQQYRDLRARVKKSGDIKDVAKLFLMKG
jgi:hypothetical protein